MHAWLEFARRPLGAAVDAAPAGSWERERLEQYCVFFKYGVPVMAAYGVSNLSQGRLLLAGFIGLSVAAHLAGLAALRAGSRPGLVYGFTLPAYALLMLYLLHRGGAGGSLATWTLTFPLMAFFHFGRREGVLLAGAFLASAAALVAFGLPGYPAYPYDPEHRFRLLGAWLAVACYGLGFQHFREVYREAAARETRALLEEKERLMAEVASRRRAEGEQERLIGELKDALGQVRTLSGLLPICASCKKIRDGAGTRVHLESFIGQRSSVTFSHGCCPDCLARLYPEPGPAGPGDAGTAGS